MRFKNIPPCKVGDIVRMYVGSTPFSPAVVSRVYYEDVFGEGIPRWFVWWNNGSNRWYWTDRCIIIRRGES